MMYVYFLNQLCKWNENSEKVGSKVTDYYYDSNNNLIAEKTDNATYEKYEMYLPYWVVSRRVYDFLIKRYPRMNFEPIFLNE